MFSVWDKREMERQKVGIGKQFNVCRIRIMFNDSFFLPFLRLHQTRPAAPHYLLYYVIHGGILLLLFLLQTTGMCCILDF